MRTGRTFTSFLFSDALSGFLGLLQGRHQSFSAFAAQTLRQLAASLPEPAAAASLRGLVSGFTHYRHLPPAQRRTLLADTEARLLAAVMAETPSNQEDAAQPSAVRQPPPQHRSLDPQPRQPHVGQPRHQVPPGFGAPGQLSSQPQGVGNGGSGGDSSLSHGPLPPRTPMQQQPFGARQPPSTQQPPPLVDSPLPAAAYGSPTDWRRQDSTGSLPQGGATGRPPNIPEPSAVRYSQMLPVDAAAAANATAAAPDDDLVLVNGRMVCSAPLLMVCMPPNAVHCCDHSVKLTSVSSVACKACC